MFFVWDIEEVKVYLWIWGYRAATTPEPPIPRQVDVPFPNDLKNIELLNMHNIHINHTLCEYIKCVSIQLL